MGAPKGNMFWLNRSKHGRDKLFKSPELLLQACNEYFLNTTKNPLYKDVSYCSNGKIIHAQEEVQRPFTYQALCLYLDVALGYFYAFEKDCAEKETKEAKGFSVVLSHVRSTIHAQKFEGAAAGFFNANLIARDLGIREVSDITTDGEKIKDGGNTLNLTIDGAAITLQ